MTYGTWEMAKTTMIRIPASDDRIKQTYGKDTSYWLALTHGVWSPCGLQVGGKETTLLRCNCFDLERRAVSGPKHVSTWHVPCSAGRRTSSVVNGRRRRISMMCSPRIAVVSALASLALLLGCAAARASDSEIKVKGFADVP